MCFVNAHAPASSTCQQVDFVWCMWQVHVLHQLVYLPFGPAGTVDGRVLAHRYAVLGGEYTRVLAHRYAVLGGELERHPHTYHIYI